MAEVPLGLKCFIPNSLDSSPASCGTQYKWFKISVFILTYLSYASYHASRKPLSVVKSYFNRTCDGLIPPPTVVINDYNRLTWCDWEPFYGPNSGTILGLMDSSFLLAYAIAMFFSGLIADRVSLRYFLAVGMILSGISCYLFGIGHYLKIHSFWFYLVVQIFGGVVQTTGWPGVVAVMGKWFGEEQRGLVFGIWNSHTSVGNVIGTVMASTYLDTNWGLSFIIPGMFIAFVGFINFLFLVEKPEDVGLFSQNKSLFRNNNSINKEVSAIGFFGALSIPGVIEFSLCLFFSKLVNYTFLYWLAFYIKSTTSFSGRVSADISTAFDVGGILGGIFAGFLSDYMNMNAVTCSLMLIFSIPALILFIFNGSLYFWLNILLLAIVGFLVNGPYALITTAVSAELGTHSTLMSNSKALATVTAIIDGTGSIGAAVGPLFAGIVYTWGNNWNNVFYMLIASNIAALLMLLRLVRKELNTWRNPSLESRTATTEI